MTGKVLRDTLLIGSIALGTGYLAIHKDKVYEMMGISVNVTRNETAPTPQVEPKAESSMPVTKLQGIAVSVPRKDGQYWATGRVNNGMVNFLVDTGATSVALTPEDARRAGINLNDLVYNVPIATAAGQNTAAAVQLKSITIGPITIRDVRAIVVPEGLHTSLLGMSFLGELQKVEATPHALILRL